MTHDERIEKAVTKLEVVVETMADLGADHEDRIRDLEANQNKGKGALYIIGSIMTLGLGERVVSWWK